VHVLWGMRVECLVNTVKMKEDGIRNRRIRLAEVEYSVRGILDELQRTPGRSWEMEEKEVNFLERLEREAMGKGDEMNAHEAFVLRMNLRGSEAGRFEDGLY
jgi:hypothetical protein